MPLTVALALLIIVPGIIALVQEGGDDNTVKSLTGLICSLALIVALEPYVDPVKELFAHRLWWQLITVSAGVIAVILVVRLKNRVCGTCILCGAGLLAMEAVGGVHF